MTQPAHQLGDRTGTGEVVRLAVSARVPNLLGPQRIDDYRSDKYRSHRIQGDIHTVDVLLAGDLIDRAAQTVTVGAEVIPYDQLALTTGSAPRRLPAAIGGDLPGVYTVRTWPMWTRCGPSSATAPAPW